MGTKDTKRLIVEIDLENEHATLQQVFGDGKSITATFSDVRGVKFTPMQTKGSPRLLVKLSFTSGLEDPYLE